ncbi:aminoglycoside phosphotransferase family protein [Nocardiopsis sp. NPDC006938]|uniref:aminoglycoside phosphotransferase family protein n=1 Tax=Nocardiopsis sp. NPDC006938 TaxID=3364337 RepID=UPI0036933CC6
MTETETPWGRILSSALAGAGLPPIAAQARPIRIGENAIFRLPGIIARVSRQGQARAAQREVDVARWLANSDFPAVRALPVKQPVLVEGRAVSFWEPLPKHSPGSVLDIARLLRELHALPIPDLELGKLDPLVRLPERIADASGHLPEDDLDWLSQRARRLRQEWDHLPAGRPWRVVHGDAWTGNVARCADGSIALMDLERCSLGPPEWDLVSTAIKARTVSWLSLEDYADFVEAYGGGEVSTWSGFELMRDIRELRMTTYFAQHAEKPAMRAEAQLRIDCLRGRRGDRPWPWTPAT